MIPVSAPPRVRRRLREAADGPVPVVHPGRNAVYLDVAGWCVGVVGSRATAVPCALRSPTGELPVAPRRAWVRDGVLHLDGAPVRIGRIVDVAVPVLPRILGAVGADAPAPGPVTRSVGHLEPGITPATVARIVGRGDGLTPLADDILCGWLALHRAARVPTPAVDAAVRAALHRTTLLSATLLDCALHGEVIPEFAAWVSALGTDDEPSRAATLAAVGHTSGTGMLHGARLALSALSRLRGAA